MCSVGYTGGLCQRCDTVSADRDERYYRDIGSGLCLSCLEHGGVAFSPGAIVVFALLALALAAVVVMVVYRDKVSKFYSDRRDRLNIIISQLTVLAVTYQILGSLSDSHRFAGGQVSRLGLSMSLTFS